MINITDKKKCCGCSACVEVCPKHCIKFKEDEQGFRYPVVEQKDCINCGLCEKVCPFLNQNKPQKPLKVYSGINPNEKIRLRSSSGGVFTMIAEAIINKGGIVFGARFNNNWEVIHDYTDNRDGLKAFRGSKYVQSEIGDCYKQVKTFLEKDKIVLFSGTGCQIAGLKKFLRKDFDNLYTVEVVCHGVPSPLVWEEYLNEIEPKRKSISNVEFRNKADGWKYFKIKIDTINDVNKKVTALNESVWDNKYMRSFLLNFCLRPSCTNCPAKSGKSRSDFAIADFWGIYASKSITDDDKGVSLILCYTDKALALIPDNLIKTEISYSEALNGNRAIEQPVKFHKNYKKFWKLFSESKLTNIDSLIAKKSTPFIIKVKNKIICEISKLMKK